MLDSIKFPQEAVYHFSSTEGFDKTRFRQNQGWQAARHEPWIIYTTPEGRKVMMVDDVIVIIAEDEK